MKSDLDFVGLLLLVVLYFIFFGCAQVPNKPVCFNDAPMAGACAWTLKGDEFHVDNSGLHNYTQDGRNWTWSQLGKNSLVMPPDTWAAFKTFILNICHDYPSDCNEAQVQSKIEEIETRALRMP